VAARAGLPPPVLEAAKERLGAAWAATDEALSRLEAETAAARREAARSREASERAEARLAEIESERAALAAEKARLAEKTRERIDRALEALRETTRREIDRLREELRAGRAVSRGALMTVTNAARQAALASSRRSPSPSCRAGLDRRPRARSPWKTTGRLLRIAPARGEAEVEVGGKRMKVAIDSLIPLAAAAPAKRSSQPSTAAAPKSAVPAPGTASAGIVLVGKRVDEALPEVERARERGPPRGNGHSQDRPRTRTGRLAAAVREYLAGHPGVASQRPGDAREGGTAVTVAVLDV